MPPNWTTLAERNMRCAPRRLRAKMPEPTEAATNRRQIIVAEASPSSVKKLSQGASGWVIGCMTEAS
jgi:hypothetical protein